MSKRIRSRKIALTLEGQYTALGMRPVGAMEPLQRWFATEPWMGGFISAAAFRQVEWDRRARELREAIRRRDAKRARDPGPDVSGRFDVNPFLVAKGHKVEVAPKHLRSDPDSQSFPKRMTTQRVIDRLKARGTISHREWMAGTVLWERWSQAVTGDRLVSAYEFITTYGSPNIDRLVEKRLDAAMVYLDCMALIPVRFRGVVMHVVVDDLDLSAWGVKTAKSERSRRRRAAKLLTRGLSALAKGLGY